MKFILSEPIEEQQFTLTDAAVNQFFISHQGWLCQKVSNTEFIQITDREGNPYADFYVEQSENQPIKRILPNVARIEF